MLSKLKYVAQALAVAGAIQFGVLPSMAQTAQRVQFAKGRTTAVLKGSLKSKGFKAYSLVAKEGQHMTVHLTSPKGNADFFVALYKGATLVEDVRDWEADLTTNGEYQIVVESTGGPATYTLEVTIR